LGYCGGRWPAQWPVETRGIKLTGECQGRLRGHGRNSGLGAGVGVKVAGGGFEVGVAGTTLQTAYSAEVPAGRDEGWKMPLRTASQAGDQGDGGFFGAGVGVEVVGGGLEVGVAEELLDGAHVHSVAHEVGGEGVS